MGKRKKYKKAVAGASAFVLGVSAFIPAAPVYAAEGISVNPQIHYQTLKGWGTSLCWWGNTIGSWGDEDFNGNGRADREEIAELAFSPEYLNLNIVRYNVGGGDKEDTSIKRCEGLVPGWTEDMTGTKDGTGEFLGEEFYNKATEDMADAGQLWMLEQANKWRSEEGDIINEVFSNSPPYYMTKSGSSTGGNSWDLNNLKDDQYDEFAQYLARAAKWIDRNLQEKYGTGVSYIEPLNEPDTTYWQNGSTKQEGCIFNTGELQSKAYRETAAALEAEGLTDIQITGTDETALWNAIHSFNRLDDDVKQNMTTIGAHTYSGNDSERKELRQIAAKYDKDLWMSEVTKGGGSHYDGCHESMDAANTRSQSEGIMADLKYMQPTAWIAWLVADSEYECLQTNSNWGLLHAVFEKDGPVPDYHTNLVNGDGSKKEWVPDEGYWAVTKQFYTMMQYSKYLKAGYTMIEIGDGNMCAALSPEGDELVIVAQNFGNERNVSVDLSKFSGNMTAEVFRTSDTESCELVDTQDVSDTTLEMTLPTNSVSTAVVRAADGSSVWDMENHSKLVEADIEKPGEEWTEAEDKFTYSGSWGDSAEEYGGGKYSTEENAGAVFTFEGDQAAIFGTKAPEGAVVNVTVDGADKGEISLYAEEKNGESLLFDTGKLDPGTHTVTLTKAEGEGDKLIELNYARIISGEFAEEIQSIKPLETFYTVSKEQPKLPKTVQAVTNKGTVVEKAVQWNLEGIDFTQDVTVYGTIEGTNWTVPAEIKVVADNIQYFVDCNSPDSPRYKGISAVSDLKNDTADKAYEEGSWGYQEQYGEYNGDINDHYDTGWYAYGGQNIAYTFPLEAGNYKVSFGFKEWWKDGNGSRPMTVSMTANGETTELGQTNTWNGGNWWNEAVYELNCPKDAEVTFTVAKAENLDPVLSFIQIEGEEKAEGNQTDFTSLKLAVDMAEKLAAEQKENQCYTDTSWKAVEKALEAAKAVLNHDQATQEDADQALLDLITACSMLENGVQKVGLKAVMEGAEAILAEEENLKQYTEESVQAVRDALAAAKGVWEDNEADQNMVNEASTRLMTAVTSMLIQEEDTRLDILIEMARQMLKKEELYTSSSVQILKDALAHAEEVNASQASEEEITEAYNRLAEAMTGLVRKADKSELENALKKANEILTNENLYVAETLANLKETAQEAEKVLAEEESSQETVGEILKKLIDEILEVRLMGDVDVSGKVDTADAAVLLRGSVELETLTKEQELIADVNQDGSCSLDDAAKILQYVSEKIESFR